MILGIIACYISFLFPSSHVLSFALHPSSIQQQGAPRVGSSVVIISATTMEDEDPSSTTTTAVTTTSSHYSRNDEGKEVQEPIDRSTLTLLEHINLNVPTPKHAVGWYVQVLGCGLDPRRAANLLPGATKRTVWANCGASQFHLPYGPVAQVIPGKIGLRYESLQGLKERLAALSKNVDAPEPKGEEGNEDDIGSVVLQRVERGVDPQGRPTLTLVDCYGNTFLCREGGNPVANPLLQQPIVRRPSETDAKDDEWGWIADQYGRTVTDCCGLEFVEFACPMGTAERIALFYDSVLDATSSVLDHPDGAKIAMVAVGNVNANGKSDQALLFRESTQPIPPYDGHHIALYVGESAADFEQAYRNCELVNVVWVNPRFEDKATNLQEAKRWKQFRFKNIVDMETGQTIMELEHEMRSIEHSAWPGKRISPSLG